jgi:hypothetical protein
MSTSLWCAAKLNSWMKSGGDPDGLAELFDVGRELDGLLGALHGETEGRHAGRRREAERAQAAPALEPNIRSPRRALLEDA